MEKTKTISCRVPSEDHEMIIRYCEKCKITVSDFVNLLLSQYNEREKPVAKEPTDPVFSDFLKNPNVVLKIKIRVIDKSRRPEEKFNPLRGMPIPEGYKKKKSNNG
jgi:hypothetical protein